MQMLWIVSKYHYYCHNIHNIVNGIVLWNQRSDHSPCFSLGRSPWDLSMLEVGGSVVAEVYLGFLLRLGCSTCNSSPIKPEWAIPRTLWLGHTYKYCPRSLIYAKINTITGPGGRSARYLEYPHALGIPSLLIGSQLNSNGSLSVSFGLDSNKAALVCPATRLHIVPVAD